MKIKVHLRQKINGLLMFCMTAAGFSIGISFYYKYSKYMMDSAAEKLKISLVAVENCIETSELEKLTLDGYRTEEYRKNWKKILNIQQEFKFKYMYIVLMNRSGQFYFVYDTADNPDVDNKEDDYFTVYSDAPKEAYQAFYSGTTAVVDEKYTDKWGTFKSAFYPIQVQGRTIGVIGADYDISYIDSLQKQALYTFLIIMIIGFIIIYSAGYVVKKIIIDPLLSINRGSKEIAEGNLDVRIALSQKDEMGELAESFNRMAEKLKSSFLTIQDYNRKLQEQVSEIETLSRAKDEFLSNLSHELKTPLTYIYMYSEILGDSEDPEQVKEYSREIFSNADKLNGYVEDLILVTDIESHLSPAEEAVSAGIIISDAEKKLKQLASEMKVSVHLGLSEDSELLCDRNLTAKAVYAVFKNSILFNREGGSVFVTERLTEEWYVISFRDTGIGVPDALKDRIFEKFFRADTSLNYEKSGVGVGLYIAAKIMDMHKGKIEVQSREGEGSDFVLMFPVRRFKGYRNNEHK